MATLHVRRKTGIYFGGLGSGYLTKTERSFYLENSRSNGPERLMSIFAELTLRRLRLRAAWGEF